MLFSFHISEDSIKIIFRDCRRKITTTLITLLKKSYCERKALSEFWAFNWAQKSRQAVWFWKVSSMILLLNFLCWWLLKLLWLMMHVKVCSQKNVIECWWSDSDHTRASFVSGKVRNQNSASQKQTGLEQTVIQKELVRHNMLVNTRKIKKTEMCCKYLSKNQYFALIKILCEWKTKKKTRKAEQNNKK